MDYEGNNFQERSFGQQRGGGGGGSFRNNDFEGSDKSVIRIPGTHIGKIIVCHFSFILYLRVKNRNFMKTYFSS